MKYFYSLLALLIISGCGDSVTNVTNITSNDTIAIKSATYGFYSSTVPSIPEKSFNYTVEYDGDISNAVLTMDTYINNQLMSKEILSYLTVPGKQLINANQRNFDPPSGLQLYFTITNSHGNDSNRYLGVRVN